MSVMMSCLGFAPLSPSRAQKTHHACFVSDKMELFPSFIILSVPGFKGILKFGKRVYLFEEHHLAELVVGIVI